jgi:hypothetical protein
MILIVVAVDGRVYLGDFLHGLPLFDGGRRLPNVRVLELFLSAHIVLLLFVGAEAAVGCSEVGVGLAIRVLVVDGVVIERKRFVFPTDDGTIVAVHARQHAFDGLDCVLLLDDV